jgi:hypothetical protein
MTYLASLVPPSMSDLVPHLCWPNLFNKLQRLSPIFKLSSFLSSAAFVRST